MCGCVRRLARREAESSTASRCSRRFHPVPHPPTPGTTTRPPLAVNVVDDAERARDPGRRPRRRPGRRVPRVAVAAATPTIDALAARGCCSATPTRTRCARRPRGAAHRPLRPPHGIGGDRRRRRATLELPLAEVTLPEALERGGVTAHTAAVRQVAPVRPHTESAFRHPNLQGFDHYAGASATCVLEPDPGTQANYHHCEKVTDGRSASWVERVRHQPTPPTTRCWRRTPSPSRGSSTSRTTPPTSRSTPPPAAASAAGPSPTDGPGAPRRRWSSAMDAEIGRVLGAT